MDCIKVEKFGTVAHFSEDGNGVDVMVNTPILDGSDDEYQHGSESNGKSRRDKRHLLVISAVIPSHGSDNSSEECGPVGMTFLIYTGIFTDRHIKFSRTSGPFKELLHNLRYFFK